MLLFYPQRTVTLGLKSEFDSLLKVLKYISVVTIIVIALTMASKSKNSSSSMTKHFVRMQDTFTMKFIHSIFLQSFPPSERWYLCMIIFIHFTYEMSRLHIIHRGFLLPWYRFSCTVTKNTRQFTVGTDTKNGVWTKYWVKIIERRWFVREVYQTKDNLFLEEQQTS